MLSTHQLRHLLVPGILVGAWAIGLLAAAEDKSQSGDLPRSWKVKEIEAEVPPYGADGKVYVLAWKITEDDRALRVESCLVLKMLPDESEEGRWCLAQLYRHPLANEPKWQLSMTHFSGKRGTKYFPGLDVQHLKRFKERPNNKVVYSSLGIEEVNWKFDQEDGWKFVGCSICEEAWQAALGEKPTKFFGAVKK